MNNINPSKINDFVQKAQEGMLCDEEFLEMESYLASSIEARRIYGEAIDLRVGLELKFRREEWEQKLGIGDASTLPPPESIREAHDGSEVEKLPEGNIPVCNLSDLHLSDIWGMSSAKDPSFFAQAETDNSLPGFLTRCLQDNGPFIAKSMVAILVLLPSILLFFVMSEPVAERAREPVAEKLPVVATVLRQTDGTQWGGDTVVPTGSQVLLGQRLRIQEGTVELRMASGVRILTEGNISLFFTGPNNLYLERGSLVAQVVPEAIGFTVRSPDADFVDLGTEFGVIVDPENMSKTKVIAGKINVETQSKKGKKTQKQLYTNEAAQIAQNGEIELIDPNSLTFTSIYPDDRVCLFDAICHTGVYYPNGLWIDPVSGQLIQPNEGRSGQVFRSRSEQESNERQYHVLPLLPVLDGIFTPAPHTRAVINSAGGRFGKIGNVSSYVHSCFVVGETGTVPHWDIEDRYKEIFTGVAGQEYDRSTKSHAFMAFHANLGVTFDLETIHRQAGKRVARFSAMGRKAEDTTTQIEDAVNHATVNKPNVLDMLILADEKVIFEKRGVTFEAGSFPVRVDIPSNTRFLTLIVADGGDGNPTSDLLPYSAIISDHLIFDEPVFVLDNETTEEKPVN